MEMITFLMINFSKTQHIKTKPHKIFEITLFNLHKPVV